MLGKGAKRQDIAKKFGVSLLTLRKALRGEEEDIQGHYRLTWAENSEISEKGEVWCVDCL